MFKAWWAIQLSLDYVFIAKFESKKIGECFGKLQAKRLMPCMPSSPCNDPA